MRGSWQQASEFDPWNLPLGASSLEFRTRHFVVGYFLASTNSNFSKLTSVVNIP